MATAREQAQEKCRQVRDAVPDEPPTHDEYAEAASDVWEPMVQRLVGVVADAFADVDGWKQAASDILLDEMYNPVVAVIETRRKRQE